MHHRIGFPNAVIDHDIDDEAAHDRTESRQSDKHVDLAEGRIKQAAGDEAEYAYDEYGQPERNLWIGEADAENPAAALN